MSGTNIRPGSADRDEDVAASVQHQGDVKALRDGPIYKESAAKLCLARWEAGRSYPCALPKGHVGRHEHPMDPVPEDHMLAVSA